MKKIIGFAAILGVLLILSGCTAASTPTNTAAIQNQPPVSGTAAVSVQNFAFSPATLTVTKGTTVTWTNNDSATHSIKSTAFSSALLSQGQTFSFTFNSTGTFNYSCSIHPSMQGEIIVK